MKKLVFALLLASLGASAQVDPKEASSDKASIMEGRLRDSKPTVEKKLADGTTVSIWLLSPKGEPTSKYVAKALATRLDKLENEGTRTVKADFGYENGKVAEVHFTQTTIIQNPTPSVTSTKKEIIFTDGVQTSPAIGSFPEIEKFVADCLSEISKA